MATRKSTWVLFGILVVSSFVLAFVIQAGAETMKFKVYGYETKAETLPVGDMEGHILSLRTRRAFCILENGEVATQIAVFLGDFIKQSGSVISYQTITFSDGSTIITKAQGSIDPSASRGTREIIKGTGRFEGIKGTGTGASKYLPVENGEAGPKSIGELILTYTLPPK
jgi:hypothetical protein